MGIYTKPVIKKTGSSSGASSINKKAVPTKPIIKKTLSPLPKAKIDPAKGGKVMDLDALIDALQAKKREHMRAVKKASEPKKIIKPTKPKVLCLECRREMSSALDTYYGRIPEAEKHCSTCRWTKFKE